MQVNKIPFHWRLVSRQMLGLKCQRDVSWLNSSLRHCRRAYAISTSAPDVDGADPVFWLPVRYAGVNRISLIRSWTFRSPDFCIYFSRKPAPCISLWHWQMGCCSKYSEREARREIGSSIVKIVSCDTTSLKSVLHRTRIFKIHSFLFCVHLISLLSCVFMP